MGHKNILEVCLSPDLGGLELFVMNCYESFKTKTSCYVVVEEGKKLDIQIEGTEKKHLKRNKFFPFIPALKLAKIIDKDKIDVIHFHWTRDILTVVLAKIFSSRKPKIVQSRHMTMTRFKDDIYHKWLYKNIDMIHAVTYQVKEQLERFIPLDVRPKIEMVYIGTKLNSKSVIKSTTILENYSIVEGEFIVGIVGRIEEGKGQWIVIDAIAQLKDLNIKLLIVGDAMDKVYLDSLKQSVKEHGVEDKVIFTGFTKEVTAHLQVCDITVLATPKETFGLVVIESMANKVPVIATNNGGPLEIIEDTVDGLLFNRTVDNLVEKLKLIYTDKILSEKLSHNAYKKILDKFDEEKQFMKLQKVLDES